jgi:hypothetical protein
MVSIETARAEINGLTEPRQPELAESRPGGAPTRGKKIQQNWRQPTHTQALSKCGNLSPPEDTHEENSNSRKEPGTVAVSRKRKPD